MMRNTLERGLEALGLDVSAGDAMCVFADRLAEKNKVMNLTAIEGGEDMANLHFLDCACLVKAARFAGKSVVDIGTGAGFPGVPLKILVPDVRLTLLDSLDKRINFLKEACEGLGFEDVEFVHARAEEFAAGRREYYDMAVSRAVAALPGLSELALPLVRVGGEFLAMKSVDSTDEIKSAERAIKLLGGEIEEILDYTIPNTDVKHRIVRIKKVSATPAKYPRRFAMIKKSPL
ncbi:MAG: 16S rRNA (guanine(527)-N(7))-methyltransferase RsmG [Oscillospiraceae bacterium]|nr:16S rRNA (guanine(527)-N(7))-methyltransferase RsmG [Oscillospiraceae bacterium]